MKDKHLISLISKKHKDIYYEGLICVSVAWINGEFSNQGEIISSTTCTLINNIYTRCLFSTEYFSKW